MLQAAIIFITLALLFYTTGIWAEKIKKILLRWHVAVFWLGFICDTIGTSAMGQISGSDARIVLNFHSVTGAVALVIMLFHTAWATFVVIRKNEK